MNIQYGKTHELFYCSEEGLYFYDSKSVYTSEPNYIVSCPKCNKSYCYFCSKYIKEVGNNNFENCCLKRLICNKLFKFEENEDEYDYLDIYSLLFIIPYISFLLMIGSFSFLLFYNK